MHANICSSNYVYSNGILNYTVFRKVFPEKGGENIQSSKARENIAEYRPHIFPQYNKTTCRGFCF